MTGQFDAANPAKITAYVPENLDLSFITTNRREAARYLVGRLYLGQYVAGRKPDEYQHLYSPLLRTVMGEGYRRKVINPLLSHGVIEEDPSYSTGRDGLAGYSKSFRLAPDYRHARFRPVPLVNPDLVRRLRDEAEATAVRAPVHRHLERWFRRLAVAPDFPPDVLPLRAWADGMTRFDPCRYGRVHTNLTNLAWEYRRHLVLPGTDGPLLAVDVKTSQPLLFGLTLRDWARLIGNAEFWGYRRERREEWRRRKGVEGEEDGDKESPVYVGNYSDVCQQDIALYVNLCLTGDLYSSFTTDTGYTRDQLKKFVLSTFYGLPEHAERSKTGMAFNRAFPEVGRLLADLNRQGGSWLACLMQTVESWVVIWRACGRLAAELPEAPLLTIHDCLVTTERYVEPVRTALLDEFDAVWGVRPQTDTKVLAA